MINCVKPIVFIPYLAISFDLLVTIVHGTAAFKMIEQ